MYDVVVNISAYKVISPIQTEVRLNSLSPELNAKFISDSPLFLLPLSDWSAHVILFARPCASNVRPTYCESTH